MLPGHVVLVLASLIPGMSVEVELVREVMEVSLAGWTFRPGRLSADRAVATPIGNVSFNPFE